MCTLGGVGWGSLTILQQTMMSHPFCVLYGIPASWLHYRSHLHQEGPQSRHIKHVFIGPGALPLCPSTPGTLSMMNGNNFEPSLNPGTVCAYVFRAPWQCPRCIVLFCFSGCPVISGPHQSLACPSL